MNLLSADEFHARLGAIQDGPWTERSKLARKKLAAPGMNLDSLLASLPIDLNSIPLSGSAIKLEKQLEVPLEWHGSGRIPTPTAQELRDSLDDALTQLQMYELAIELGYLPQEQVARVVTNDLVSLLWSRPARRFVRDYDYTAVETLAERMHVKGMHERRPFNIDPSGAVYFASFLTTCRTIELDLPCETWLRFLDDYVIRRGEQNEFYEFLLAGEQADSKRRQMLVLGARNFALMLADFLTAIPEHLQDRFGAFYSYWLAKLFGYELRGNRYVRNTELWGRNEKDSWANAVATWFEARKVASGDDSDESFEGDLVSGSLSTLNTVWKRMRQAVVTPVAV